MELWKRNLIVCWIGMFATGIGFSQIAPILPLYIQHLGVQNAASVEAWSGLAFGVTFLVSAIFSPIWGRAADRYGRKPMLLRASLGMSLVIFLMGFSQNVTEFIILRLLQGVITGYSTACTTLIATQTDKEHAGTALGTLATSGIAGSLLGPMVGGFIGETFGFQNVFFLTGDLMLVTFLLTLFFVKEVFVRPEVKIQGNRDTWRSTPHKSITRLLFISFFVTYVSLFSIEPILTVYISGLSLKASHIAFLAGLIFSASGLATLIASPLLGRVADRWGPHKVLLFSLGAAGLFTLPQAWDTNPWQLMALRFLLGLATGGMTPALNSLVKRITPQAIAGRIFGYSMSAGYLGVFCGSLLGGQMASAFGLRSVFYVVTLAVFLNALLVYFGIYLKFPQIEKGSLRASAPF